MYQVSQTARMAPLLLVALLASAPAWPQDPGASVSAEDIPLDDGSPPTLDDVAEEAALEPVPDEPTLATPDEQDGVVDTGSAAATTAGEEADEPLIIPDSQAVTDYREAIAELEDAAGAYGEGLAEKLLGLGLSLQQQGRHAEAVSVFKRGVHLSRVNNGLYSGEQIPLLQSQISSHLALGDYETADERQTYLYRVQQRALDKGVLRAEALMQQARWQRQAYDLGLGEYGFVRLLAMWDLYRMALTDIADREGDNSPNLLAPLYGMLQSQYLIAGFQGETASGGFDTSAFGSRQDDGRFNAYKSTAYKRGRSVINAIYTLNQETTGGDKVAAAQDLVLMGDWQFWHGMREGALETYRSAIMELAELDDAQQQTERLFGAPAPLPDLDGVRPLPPNASPDMADLLLEFTVSPGGRVVDMTRLDENLENESKANRLMRQLRKTRFRPRFEGVEPVETEISSWAYDTTQW